MSGSPGPAGTSTFSSTVRIGVAACAAVPGPSRAPAAARIVAPSRATGSRRRPARVRLPVGDVMTATVGQCTDRSARASAGSQGSGTRCTPSPCDSHRWRRRCPSETMDSPEGSIPPAVTSSARSPSDQGGVPGVTGRPRRRCTFCPRRRERPRAARRRPNDLLRRIPRERARVALARHHRWLGSPSSWPTCSSSTTSRMRSPRARPPDGCCSTWLCRRVRHRACGSSPVASPPGSSSPATSPSTRCPSTTCSSSSSSWRRSRSRRCTSTRCCWSASCSRWSCAASSSRSARRPSTQFSWVFYIFGAFLI